MPRQFDFEWYEYKGSHSHKIDAQKAAVRLRKLSWKIRVVKGQSKIGRKGLMHTSTKYELWGLKKK